MFVSAKHNNEKSQQEILILIYKEMHVDILKYKKPFDVYFAYTWGLPKLPNINLHFWFISFEVVTLLQHVKPMIA